MAARRSRRERQPPADLGAALEVAFRFLATRPRSRAEVARRLRRAGTGEALLEACLVRLGELGYVDDRAFVRYWTEQRDTHAPRSQALLNLELRRLGVDTGTLDGEGEELPADAAPPEDDESPPETPTELDQARAVRALEHRLRGKPLDGADPGAVKRALEFLARRGFGYDVSRTAVRRVGESFGTDEDRSRQP